MTEVGCQCIMQCQSNRSYVGVAPRIAAYIIDKICAGVLIAVAAGVIGILSLCGLDFLMNDSVLFKYTIAAIVFYLIEKAYFIVFTASTGQTPGKMLFRIKVVNEDGSKVSSWNIIYREVIGRFLSGLPMIAFAGYLMIIPDQEKRGLHDRLCDTRVIYDDKVNNEKIYTSDDAQGEINRLFNIETVDSFEDKDLQDIEVKDEIKEMNNLENDELKEINDIDAEVNDKETVETIIQSAEEMETKIDDMSKDIDNIINNVSEEDK